MRVNYLSSFMLFNLMRGHVLVSDYTDTPEINILPGDVNMEKLSEMYLSRRSRKVEEDGTVVETTELVKR